MIKVLIGSVLVLFLTASCGSGWPLLVFNVPLGGRTEIGQQGPPGEPGLACWDLDGNGECDGNDDWNGDGVCDVYDCRGADGSDGDAGATGEPGPQGDQGDVGDPGQDGVDGEQGDQGVPGDPGPPGGDGQDGSDGVGPCENGNPHGPCDD